jgi:poly(A) polymerase
MRKAAQRIVEKLRLHGHEAFFAGGWVRDFLLRRKPKDIDIVTSARPEQVMALFPRSTAIGSRFGVVQVRLYGHAYEVATFRKEGAYLDGRHPSEVSYSGPEQDVRRRDFTVNALFYDPIANRVIDYIHGKADIRRRIIRTVGAPEERFAEDKLRMLRAVRFACNLDFEIAPGTWSAIRQHSGKIREVSWERIRDELTEILTGPNPARGLDLLHESGLLEEVLPEIEAMHGVAQPPEFHPEGDVFTHTKQALAHLRKPSPALAFGTLLHDVGKPPTFAIRERIRFDGHVPIGVELAQKVCRRLRFSNEEIEQILDLVANHLRFMHVHQMRTSTLIRFLSKSNFADHLELHRADCLSSRRDLDSYYFCLEKLKELERQPPPTQRLITGNDLIAMGYEPGPIFREILEQIENLQLEGIVNSRDEALGEVQARYPLHKPEAAVRTLE